MATALITGATGLIGRSVLQLWPAGELEPVVVDRAHDDLLVSGTPTSLVERHRPAVVVHLAWCASGTLDYRRAADNARWVRASRELADAAGAVGAQAFFTGTALDGTEGIDAYSAAKAQLRATLTAEVRRGQLTWLRPFYVVSPRARRPAVVAEALRAAGADEPVSLRTPDSAHDFIHVDDVGHAVVASVQHQLQGTVDIGTGVLRSVQQLVEALGARAAHELHPGPEVPHHHDVADTAALAAVGWRPTLTEELFRHV